MGHCHPFSLFCLGYCHNPNYNVNSTQSNLNCSWVWHENDFAHHHPQPSTTTPPTHQGASDQPLMLLKQQHRSFWTDGNFKEYDQFCTKLGYTRLGASVSNSNRSFNFGIRAWWLIYQLPTYLLSSAYVVSRLRIHQSFNWRTEPVVS